jgi:hypothetical protein
MRVLTLCTALALAIAFCAAPSFAAPKVTVSISGSIDEMLPILQHLRAMGIGFGASEPEESGLKVDMHSFADDGGKGASAVLSSKQAAAGLSKAAAAPAKVRPGDVALISVQVSDPDRQVDTLGATAPRIEGVDFDLYDNGRYGDKKAKDGTWSYVLTIPANVPPGNYALTLLAYDANGDPLQTADKGAPRWTSEVTLTVVP